MNRAEFLLELIRHAPFPIRMIQTDNGTAFTNVLLVVKSAHKTLLEEALLEMGIEYKRIRIATRRHNGKVERQHLTDEERFYSRMRMYSLAAAGNWRSTRENPTPISMIRDTLEQWDVLHHMPTAMQRAAATNLNNFLVTQEGLAPVTNGPWFCLGDGLEPWEWRTIRLAWDNGYTPHVQHVPGFTVLWSNARRLAEVDALIGHRGWISAKWMAELMAQGAALHKIAPIESLDAVEGPLLVPNPALLPAAELARVRAYDRGLLLYIGALPDDVPVARCRYVANSPWQRVACWLEGDENIESAVFEHTTPRPDRLNALPELFESWRHALPYHPVAEGFVEECAQWINRLCDYPTLTTGCIQLLSSSGGYATTAEDNNFCHVTQVTLSARKDRFLIENEAYYYIMPLLHCKRRIAHVDILTKPVGYPAPVTDFTVGTSVPGRGMDIVEVTYAEEAAPGSLA